MLGDPVEQLLNHLVEGHLLGRALGDQADVLERDVQDRPKPVAQPFFVVRQRVLQELGEALALLVGDAGHRQPLGHAAQVVRDAHKLQTGERPLDRAFPGRQRPFDEVEGE